MADKSEDQRHERRSKDSVNRPLPKRFYKTVSVSNDRSILLDDRLVKTPLKANLTLPTSALAEAVASEWRAQATHIDPALMPLTKLANTAIDRVGAERAHVAGEVMAFAGNDLVCYRAQEPAVFVALQAKAWDPVLDWAGAALNAKFQVTKGVVHVAQPLAALEAVEYHVSALDDFALTGVHNLTTLTGSALLALMLHNGAIAAEDAWAAAHVDEDFQISQWGHDFEASARRSHRKVEFDATARFMALLTQP